MEAAVLERPRARVRSRRVRSETNIHIRATAHVKHLIDTAAVAVGKTLSEFMLDSARNMPLMCFWLKDCLFSIQRSTPPS